MRGHDPPPAPDPEWEVTGQDHLHMPSQGYGDCSSTSSPRTGCNLARKHSYLTKVPPGSSCGSFSWPNGGSQV